MMNSIVTISLEEYFRDIDKYKEIDDIYIICINKHYNIKFNVSKLPSKPYVYEGKYYVIPTYSCGSTLYSKASFIRDYPHTEVTDYYIEIDYPKYNFNKNYKGVISYNDYVNMNEYEVSDKMHWTNIEVIEFYKAISKTSVVRTNDLPKVKKILKELCNTNNTPVNYVKVQRLLTLTGHTDEEYERFVKRGRRGE